MDRKASLVVALCSVVSLAPAVTATGATPCAEPGSSWESRSPADPGPYPGSDLVLPPLDKGIVGDANDLEQVLAGAGLGPAAPAGCTPLGCQ